MKALILSWTLLIGSGGLTWRYARAGNTKCDISKEGAPCSMKSCAHLAKKQPWCSPKCHKDCCFCPREGRNSCNGHNPEQTPSPEEE